MDPWRGILDSQGGDGGCSGSASSRPALRIRAHILLCWLALLLIRVAETETSRTWTAIRTEIDRLHLGVFTGPAGTFAQRTELSQPQKTLLTKLRITKPPRILDATPATA